MEAIAELYIFAENVRELRAHYAHTKQEFAQIMGITITAVRKLEAGTPPPLLKIIPIVRLAQYFKVPIYRMLLPNVLELVVENGFEKPAIDSTAKVSE